MTDFYKEETTNQLYSRIRSNRHIHVTVVLIRYLIAFAFIPSGLKKVFGLRFTQMGVDTPIGFFFEALYQSGVYWIFLGIVQVVTAFLLMTQRWATLGAVFFFFIILNIWMITISLHFSGTWVITSLMLLACLLLLLWDYPKLKFLFFTDSSVATLNRLNNHFPKVIWAVAGSVLFILSVAGICLFEKYLSTSRLLKVLWLSGFLLTVLLAFGFNELYYHRNRRV